MKSLKSKLTALLRRGNNEEYLSKDQINKIEEDIELVSAELDQIEDNFHLQIGQELRWGLKIDSIDKNKNIVNKIKRQYYKWANELQKDYFNLIEEFYHQQNKKIKLQKKLVKENAKRNKCNMVYRHREDFASFLSALRVRTIQKQESLFNEINLQNIYKAFPIWLCTFSDLYKVIPNQSSLFDMVIIDEASQCDIASALPAMQRAKKIVVVGDTLQLRHYSFLSEMVIQGFKKKWNIQLPDRYTDYRNNSVLDVYFGKINNQDQVAFLEEHFRGNNSLIGFSNAHIYEGALKVMKALPHQKANRNSILFCNGKRDKTGANLKEINAVLEQILNIVNQQEESNQFQGSSIGVISPISAQVEALEDAISAHFSLEIMEKHRIKVGTPYGFQGDERDIILISWCIDDSTHPAALRHINQPEVFNVTVTRAKLQCFHFTSFDESKMDNDGLLKKYLGYIQSFSLSIHKNEKDTYGNFLLDVVGTLEENGFTNNKTRYQIAHLQIDILCKSKKGYVGIDLIGYPGDCYEAHNLHDYQTLQRTGLKMLAIPYSNWIFDGPEYKNKIVEYIKKATS